VALKVAVAEYISSASRHAVRSERLAVSAAMPSSRATTGT